MKQKHQWAFRDIGIYLVHTTPISNLCSDYLKMQYILAEFEI
jgi:hypothetical protein